MEAIILILIIGSFAWWCFSQGSSPREKSEADKRKEADAWIEDMHGRYKEPNKRKEVDAWIEDLRRHR
jgi:ferric-dicitrate binding protein FerR (iron transport regulator)